MDWPAYMPGDRASFNTGIFATDANADGRQDVVVFQAVGVSYASIAVLLGRGDGAFDPPVVQSIDQLAGGVITDVNHDRPPDVVMCGLRLGFQPGPALVEILLGKGDGTFGAPVNPSGSPVTAALGCAVGDIDRDGNLDLVLRMADAGPLLMFLGKGDGTFATAQDIAPGLDAATVGQFVDVNGDGRLDLVLMTRTGFAVLLGAR